MTNLITALLVTQVFTNQGTVSTNVSLRFTYTNLVNGRTVLKEYPVEHLEPRATNKPDSMPVPHGLRALPVNAPPTP